MAASMYWYRQGTVSVAAGGSVVTGVNTYWLTAMQPPVPGDAFTLDGDKWYEVAEILSDTQLKIHGTIASAVTGVGYQIKPVVSAAPALRISAEISAVLQQQRLFFLTLNDFWYKPGVVSVTDPFGVTHQHKTLYELNAGLADLSSRLQTMVATAENSVNLFAGLQQGVNNLSATVAGLQSNVDGKLASATTSANEAKSARDLALGYRNDANTALADVTAKHGQVSTWHGEVNTKLGEVTTKLGEVTTKHSDVVTKAADVVTKHGDVVTKSADVVTKHGDVVAKHTQVGAWYSAVDGWQATVSTKHADVVSKHGDMLSATTNAQNSATLAQRWAAEAEGVIVASGLYSSRHYMLQSMAYAQQTAANVSGGLSFRGFHNPASGFPVGADTGYQYKLSGPGNLTFEIDGAKDVSAGDYIIKTATGWVHLDDATDAVKITRKVNGQSLAADIVLTAANVGARADTWFPTFAQVTSKPTTLAGYNISDAVPSARKVNNKALSADIVLSAADVNAVPTGDARLTDAREWTAATVTQADAEAGLSTTRTAWTPERVKQAITAQAAPKTSTNDRLTALETAPNANETAELALALALMGM